MSKDKRHNRKKPRTFLQWTLIVGLCLVCAGVLGCGFVLASDLGLFDVATAPTEEELASEEEPAPDTFCYGIYVDGISVGGLTRERAAEKILAVQKEKMKGVSAKLYYGEREIELLLTDCNVAFDTDRVLDTCMAIGRDGMERENSSVIWNLPDHPVEYDTTMIVDPSPLQERCINFAESLEGEATDAAVLGFDGKMPEGESGWITIPEKDGLTIDYEAMWKAVDESFGNCTFNDVELTGTVVEAKVKLDDLMADKQLIAKFHSTLTDDANRTANIKRACESISNLWLQPGEEFSFNQVVGPRTKATGYLEAGVIVGGDHLDEGMGGGICQVSGTLFNAVVMSDLEITERYTHSFELSYLRRGRDATVDYGTKDFKFKNTLECPILIQMYVDGTNRLCYAEIYGVKRTDGLTIDIEVETTREIDPKDKVLYETLDSLESGETKIVKARKGVRCTSYKVYKNEAGEVVKKEQLFKDEYPPIQAKVYYSPYDPKPDLSVGND